MTKTKTLWKTPAILAAFVLGLAVTACDNPASTPPPVPASISLDISGTHTFAPVQIGYAAVTPLTVTVSNAGGRATDELTVALSGTNANSFSVSAPSIPGIAAGGSATFTVGPRYGLTARTHIATVTVSGEGITAQIFDVSFTVNEPAPIYGISLSVTGTQTFG